jgi:hypothetical protein
VPHEPVPGASPRWRRLPRARAVVSAAAVAATLSGAPSTTWALLTGGDALAATRAAGTLLPHSRADGSLAGGVLVHAVISLGWTVVLAGVLPPARRALPQPVVARTRAPIRAPRVTLQNLFTGFSSALRFTQPIGRTTAGPACKTPNPEEQKPLGSNTRPAHQLTVAIPVDAIDRGHDDVDRKQANRVAAD